VQWTIHGERTVSSGPVCGLEREPAVEIATGKEDAITTSRRRTFETEISVAPRIRLGQRLVDR
jgi:hypothetical protein